MKIVFMGTPQPSARLLADLSAAGHRILCVVTRPDQPAGRGLKITFSPVKELALKLALPLEQPEKIKENKVLFSLLSRLEPEAIVVAAFGRILPKEILQIPKFGCINVHASLLPKYRGAAPVQWAILNGEKETGVTIMQMDEGLDTGDILAQQKLPIEDQDTSVTLEEKLFAAAAKLLNRSLLEIENGELKPRRQDSRLATYAPLITKESAEIEWRKSARQIHNRIRAMLPWPVAHTFRGKKILKILKSEISGREIPGEPGTIVEIIKNKGFSVAAGEGNLIVTELQTEGKRAMPAGQYLNGHDVKINETLPN